MTVGKSRKICYLLWIGEGGCYDKETKESVDTDYHICGTGSGI